MKSQPAKHLTRNDYGSMCEITTREPPAGYQQWLIDQGSMPASVAVLWCKCRIDRPVGMVQRELFYRTIRENRPDQC